MAQRKMLGITSHFRRQDGKSVDPPPSKFDRSGYYYSRAWASTQLVHSHRVLEGNLKSLMNAFTWSSTPQGTNVWQPLYRGEAELLPEDRDYIEWLLEEYGDGLR
jgi:hypothetical protein